MVASYASVSRMLITHAHSSLNGEHAILMDVQNIILVLSMAVQFKVSPCLCIIAKIETLVDELSNTLLLIEKIRSTSGEILSFWDSGSTLTLVAKSYIEDEFEGSTCIL